MTSPPALHTSLALLLLGVGLGVGGVSIGLHASDARTQAQGELDAAARAAVAQEQARRHAEALAPRLAQLASAGAFAQASRLDWVDALERAATELRLPGLQWRLAARTPVPGFAGLGFVTPISLDLALLHEGDLLRLDEWLRRHAPGPWQFQTCELQAVPLRDAPVQELAAARVTARCELHGYTLQKSDGA